MEPISYYNNDPCSPHAKRRLVFEISESTIKRVKFADDLRKLEQDAEDAMEKLIASYTLWNIKMGQKEPINQDNKLMDLSMEIASICINSVIVEKDEDYIDI
jgi:hypothetical protein